MIDMLTVFLFGTGALFAALCGLLRRAAPCGRCWRRCARNWVCWRGWRWIHR